MAGSVPPPGLPRRVDQFVPSWVLHDAISNHVGQLRRALISSGCLSDIFYEHVEPSLSGEGRHFRESDTGPDPDRLILYHASTDSAMAGWLVTAAERGQAVALDYHNITPSRYFGRWEPRAARSMDKARQELAALVACSTLAVADSAYNERELVELGHDRTGVCPLLVDLSDYHAPPDAERLARLRSAGEPNLLFVGRIAPNKCQHDVMAAFAVFRRLFAPRARLALVGGATSQRYLRSLEAMAGDLELGDSVELVGAATFPELLAHFHAADAFVCLSEHEGFCVPVMEAMELGVPVVAYRAAAVPDTVAGAGVLLDDKDPLQVAVAIQGLLGDEDRKARLVAAGRQRAAGFSVDVTAPAFVTRLAALLAGRQPEVLRGSVRA